MTKEEAKQTLIRLLEVLHKKFENDFRNNGWRDPNPTIWDQNVSKAINTLFPSEEK